jgi:monolysocardiolipin acyltransferase
MDDPIMWGILPYSYHWDPNNVRWGLASHDLAFQNKYVCETHHRKDAI